MIKITKADLKAYADARKVNGGSEELKKILSGLYENYSVKEILKSFVDAQVELMAAKKEAKKINITKEQIDKHFNVLG